MDFSATHRRGTGCRRIYDNKGTAFLVRKMIKADEAAVCKVCLRTGDAGKDASSHFIDGMLLGRRWVLPYFEHNPSLSLVLEEEAKGSVVGYALGCLDTNAFEVWMQSDYLPRMRKLYPLEGRKKVEGDFKDEEVVQDFHHFDPAPKVVYY